MANCTKEYVVIDTNVPLKASDTHPEDALDQECASRCLDFINSLTSSTSFIIVLDDKQEVLSEYRKKINANSGATVASVFLKWVCRSINTQNVDTCTITKFGDTYQEFPNSVDLEKFDRSDRKFVAIAKAHSSNPTIYNGSDTDWWIFKDALEKEGIHISFLCEEYLRVKFQKKKKSPT